MSRDLACGIEPEQVHTLYFHSFQLPLEGEHERVAIGKLRGVAEVVGEQIVVREAAKEKADVLSSLKGLGYERRVKDDVGRERVDQRFDVSGLYGQAHGMGGHET